MIINVVKTTNNEGKGSVAFKEEISCATSEWLVALTFIFFSSKNLHGQVTFEMIYFKKLMFFEKQRFLKKSVNSIY